MHMVSWVQIPNEVICVSLCANALEKGENQTLLSPTMGK